MGHKDQLPLKAKNPLRGPRAIGKHCVRQIKMSPLQGSLPYAAQGRTPCSGIDRLSWPVCTLCRAILIAASELSIPMQCLPSWPAATKVPPEPQKQSSTVLPSREDVDTIIFSSSMFFSVGYIGLGGSLNPQMS